MDLIWVVSPTCLVIKVVCVRCVSLELVGLWDKVKLTGW